jgi:hypothetical protein
MSNTFTAIKRAAKVALKETLRPRQFQVASHRVVCSLCGSDEFQWHGHGALGTRYKVLGVEGYALQCCRCSHLELFGKRPEEL